MGDVGVRAGLRGLQQVFCWRAGGEDGDWIRRSRKVKIYS